MLYGQGRKKNSRNTGLFIDGIHVVTGVLIVILAVITFLDPEENQVLLPLIFALAAILYAVNGVCSFRLSGRNRSGKAVAAVQLAVALFLILTTVVSGISIWRR